MMSNKLNKIAIVDLETTGPSVEKKDRIIQIGAVIISDGIVVAEHSMFINPERSIPFHIQQLTGIKEEEIQDAPTFQSVAPLWYERLKDCVFVAHNVAFDLTFLQDAFKMYGFEFNPIAVDSVRLAKIILPTAKGFNLTDLSNYFQLEFVDAHDALADAQVTSQIVSGLAQKVKQMPESLFNRMKPFIEQFTYDEILFFKQPDLFIIPADTARTERALAAGIIPGSISKLNVLQAEYIIEQWKENSHLIVENTIKPLNHEIIINLADIYQRQHKLLISLPSKSDLNFIENYFARNTLSGSYTVLKSHRNYLHRSAFEEMTAAYDFSVNNQQELLVITATMNWASESPYGDYNELNQELNIQSLLEKYCPTALKVSNHENYHNVIAKAKESRWVITYDRFLQTLFKYNHPFTETIIQRHLIIYNVSLFIRMARLTYEESVSISLIFTTLRNLQAQLSYHYEQIRETNPYNPMITGSISILSQIINGISQQLEQEDFDYSQQQEDLNVFTSSHSALAALIEDHLNHLQENLKQLQQQLENSRGLAEIEPFKEDISKAIEQINYFNNHSALIKYFVILSKRVHHQFYDIHIVSRPLIFAQKQLDWLKKFKQTLLISPGNFNQYQAVGNKAWLNLDNFTYLKMPDFHLDKKRSVIVPAEYIHETAEEKRFEMLNSLLKDSALIKHSQIIMMMANQKQVKQLYQSIITDKELTEKFTVLAQGVTGSTNRIRRRIEENPRSIVIITERLFYKEQWSAREDVSIILYNLPFYSPSQSDIMAISDYITQKEENVSVFDKVQLPMMIQRFKYLLSYLEQYYSLSDFLLLDQRIYTKHYGNRVVEALEKSVDFDLIE